MRNELENSDWLRTYTALNEQTSIEDKWLSLKSMLIKQKENFVSKQSASGKPSWKNKGCFPIKRTQEAIKNKNKTYRAWMRSTVLIDSESSRLEYTKARNKVRTMVRRAKREFENGIAVQAKINPTKFWSHTRRNLKTKSGVAPLLAHVEDNDSLKFDDIEKANILQKQFSGVYTREPDGDIPTLGSRTESSITNLYVTEEMVRKELKNLNAIKSCGHDEKHTRLIKELAEKLSGPIARLFNMTIEQQTLPNDWKQALVSPIFKKGSKCLAVNYRPISLTSVFRKVIETFIKEKIMSQELL